MPAVRILITAGPTREYVDDVRYLSNASTGQMGLALARAAVARGHRVTLVHGPLPFDLAPAGGRRRLADRIVPVTSALEMRRAVRREFASCRAFICCAAVSDYRPARRIRGKLKRDSRRRLLLKLVRNPDIVHEASRRRRPGQIVVGFALETRNGRANARAKLRRKGLDAIVLNPATAIGAKATQIAIFVRGASGSKPICCTKDAAARRIIQLVERLAAARSPHGKS